MTATDSGSTRSLSGISIGWMCPILLVPVDRSSLPETPFGRVTPVQISALSRSASARHRRIAAIFKAASGLMFGAGPQ